MTVKLVVCFCICFMVFLGSIVGFCKGLDFQDSRKRKVELFGTLIAIASVMLMVASLGGVIAFAIKLFILYLYGVA